MKEIKLTHGFVALVDDEDYGWLNKRKWCYNGNYAWRYNNVSMSNQIMNPPNGFVVDHIDGNKLNNRRENLRICTRAENSKNKRGRGVSKYKGVSRCNRGKKQWQSQIQNNGKPIFIGRFISEIDAAKHYDYYARKLHKEYAKLNFPD